MVGFAAQLAPDRDVMRFNGYGGIAVSRRQQCAPAPMGDADR
jgi:hypothetical protein